MRSPDGRSVPVARTCFFSLMLTENQRVRAGGASLRG